MSDYSFISNAHPTFIETMYKKYQENPDSVEEGWRTFFKGFDYADNGKTPVGSNGNGSAVVKTNGVTNGVHKGVSFSTKEFQVLSLIKAYRNRGHLSANTHPLKNRKEKDPNLDLDDFGLSEADLNSVFQAGKEAGLENATLKEIITHLDKVYCGNIGFEYHHIEDRAKRRWFRKKIELHHPDKSYGIPLEKKKRILEKLNGAVIFEKFLHTKYVGQKRFSLEGGESAIVALDTIINSAAAEGVKEIIIGMAHRGRLNVLANIMGKTYESIFKEFEGTALPDTVFGDGDVKYHLGFSSQIETPSGNTVNLKLMPNPSHLEAVNTVVEGYSRAKADVLYGSDYDQILPILIHGDAAVAGQGIVYETVQMSQLDGYYTGGTIHFVINNQIGFTTTYEEARSSTYCTGVASLVQAPVFHVNGDDPEAILFAMEFALEYRQKFNNDVFIDMVCYRKHGHNEGDDPKFTQPHLYELINAHKNPREVYSEKLISGGEVGKQLAEQMEKQFWNDLQNRLDAVKQKDLPYEYQAPEKAWRELKLTVDPKDFVESPVTGIDAATGDQIIQHLMTIPDDFTPLGKINRLLKSKKKLLDKGQLDWAMGELLAYSSILLEGKDVRMTGQDVRRGTFSHRHAYLKDEKTFEPFNRLEGMSAEQGRFMIYNSFLSEYGVLGFEYGYSLANPHSLVVWEAQFGDFYNGAQIMVDQFITAGESKWGRMSGLVMLLPHGYAGQGPEHSSARPERFLQACADFNMTVANITTPANFFHALRRQLARPFRKPLVVMSPKSLLRHSLCVSPLEDFETGKGFQELIDDSKVTTAATTKKIKRVLYCTGKVYYDLLAKKEADKREDVAIVRLEQLYPFPLTQMEKMKEKYKNAEAFWVQEEPSNMGAWQYFLAFYRNYDIKLISRRSSSSPATGFKKIHDKQQKALVEEAFK